MTHPMLGWSLVVGVIAIAGMPPLVGFGALLLRLQGLAFGEPKGSSTPVQASYLPMVGHLGLVLTAGLYLPPPLVTWF